MFKKISWMTVLQAANTILPFITIPYLVRVLGVSGYGAIGVAVAVSQYLQLIVEHGYTLSAARSVAQDKENKSLASDVFINVTLSKLLLFILGTIILGLGIYIVNLEGGLEDLIIIGLLIVFGQLMIPTWLYVGKDRADWLLILTIIPKAIAVPIIFITINSPEDINMAMMWQGLPFVVTGVIALLIAFKMKWVTFSSPDIHKMKGYYKQGWPLFLSSASTSLYTSSTPIILNAFSGTHAVGLFLVADKIRQAAQSVITPISLVVFPRVSRLLVEDRDKAYFELQHLSIFVLAMAFFIALTFNVFAEFIIEIVYSSEAIESSVILQILGGAMLLVFANTILGTYIMIPSGMEKKFSLIILIAGFAHLIVLSILSMGYAEIGAAISVMFTEVLMFVLMVKHLSGIDTQFERCSMSDSIISKIIKAR